jgi:hypothetical protein
LGVFTGPKEDSIYSRELPGHVVGQAAHHAPLQFVLFLEDVLDLQQQKRVWVSFQGRKAYIGEVIEASIDHKPQVREFSLEPEDPVVLEGWYGPVLMRAQPVEEALSRMYYELLNPALLTYDLDKISHVLIAVHVIYAEAALYGHRDGHCFLHFSCYLSNELGLEHKDCPEAPVSGLIRGAPTIHIDLIVAKVLGYLRSLCHLRRIVSTDLAHNRMLRRIKPEHLLFPLLRI